MGPSIWQLLIVLAIVLVLFGAKRLRNVGGDLGAAIKGFRGAMKDKEEDKNAAANKQINENAEGNVIEGEVTSRETPQEKDKV